MKLGHVRLLGELARGGMGVVHLGEIQGPGGFAKRVVVKELKPELATDARYRDMFLDEARIAARLSHPNIVQTFEVASAGDRWFMVLEHLEGASLDRVIRALGPALTPAVAARIVCDVLAALHHAHELRNDAGEPLAIVHRDVSPRNVFVTLDGAVKLLDFGVAKSRGRSAETTAGVVKGSVGYMSPDHVTGATIDRRADVFAAGVLLREMLLGEKLWDPRLADLEVIGALAAHAIPAFPEGRGVPEALVAIARRATAGQRSERFASAHDMQEALEVYLDAAEPRGARRDLGRGLERALAEATARASAQPRGGPTTLPTGLLVSAPSAHLSLSAPGGHRRPGGSPHRRWAAAAAMLAAAFVAVTALAPRQRALPEGPGELAEEETPPSPARARGEAGPAQRVDPGPLDVETNARAELDRALAEAPIDDPLPELPPNPYD
jgi:serine/threonine protein kinase